MGVAHSAQAEPSNSGSAGGCPVKHGSASKSSKNMTTVDSEPGKSACPVSHGGDGGGKKYKNKDIYNVYNQKIDPTNQMPSRANQKKSPNQSVDLPTEREKSTIPKGGTDADTWQYPSPQMFWNALVRKEKTEGANEEDITSVVAVHNNMNETTWKQVAIWESLVDDDGYAPTLLRFLGRPDDLSPKARFKALAGHPKPFDRHDWYVDRGGKEVRYIIDYYHDESSVSKDTAPKSMHDTVSMKSIHVDVRPALDSVEAVLARVFRMPFARFQKDPKVVNFRAAPFFAPSVMVEAEIKRSDTITKQWQQIKSTCEQKKNALQECQGDDECGAASVELQKCTSSVVCPDIATAFEKSMTSRDDAKIEHSYGKMLKCLEMFEIESREELGRR